ncbi:MAG: hypothetical protein M1837_001132 [Sclerophora amabilis]|nr:MAG: hypothetical protein M1837_001132 [Sclerophora amabilis]
MPHATKTKQRDFALRSVILSEVTAGQKVQATAPVRNAASRYGSVRLNPGGVVFGLVSNNIPKIMSEAEQRSFGLQLFALYATEVRDALVKSWQIEDVIHL